MVLRNEEAFRNVGRKIAFWELGGFGVVGHAQLVSKNGVNTCTTAVRPTTKGNVRIPATNAARAVP